MDIQKTGQLIAQARKAQGLTQRALADRLHLSDRTVSKWERGAGFPDVQQLEPLSQVLGLSILSLLRGEPEQETSVQAAVSETIVSVQQGRRVRLHRRLKSWGAALLALAGIVLLLSCLTLLRWGVDRTVIMGVYQDGVQRSVTQVRVTGYCYAQPVRGLVFCGQIQTALSPITMEEERKLLFKIPITSHTPAYPFHQSWVGNVYQEDGPFPGDRFVLTSGVEELAFELTDGRILASSPAAYQTFSALYNLPPLKQAPAPLASGG